MSDQYASYPSLINKTVFVTGGASGIGGEIVKVFDKQGARVGILDVNQAAGDALLGTLEHKENHALVQCDLRDLDALQQGISTLTEALGHAHVLVNNAARDDRHDWRTVTGDYWDERMQTNLRHMFFAIQATAPGMIEMGGGSIINMGSNSWWEAGGGFPCYATAKAAVHGLTRTMARDLGEHRIRVNAVVPGWIMTQRQKELWVTDESIEKHRQRQCLPDLINPEHVANMVAFLASDDARMCTASNFMVDAGSI